ncbi:FUSC family protein [Streptomyces olivaceiscleroticus]|uniref:Integral membrane bound transporter domain-containing protein n=1 Tax=Streptomyces olivaceiscleroticus TaxID=68245 RepID=A0ABN0ZHP1_9ACTN
MSEVKAWGSALQHSFRAALKVERVFSDPWAIARAVLAVIAASVIGALLDDPLAWAMMTVGTFICGIGTLLAPIRHRAVNALALGAGFTLATLIGVFLHPMGWWFLIVLALAAYLAGLWRALGVAPGIRACLVTIGLMITADLSPGVSAGLTMVRWIAAGAALVVLVQLLPPYGRRHPAQRKAVAAVYRTLADTARAGEPAPYLSSAPFTAARSALDLLPGFARPAAAPLYGLLTEAENIRRALLFLPTGRAARLPRPAIAEALDAVARTVLTAQRQDADAETARLLDSWTGPEAEALRPRLQEAARLADHWLESRGPDGLDQVLDAFPAENALRSGWRRLRAELRPGAPLFLHAIRIAVGTAAGEAVGRACGDFWGYALPDHGFWAALTTMLVLFPDYGHTFARGWARPIGSILGGLAAWVVLLPSGWSAGWLVAVATVLAACVFLTLRVGQLVLNFFITAWIVFLISRLGSAPHLIEWGRPADTLVGALLGLVVFVAIPTYHHHRTHELLADWLRVQRRLLPALVTGYAEAGAVDAAEIDVLRRQARQARERLDGAIASLGHEPRRHRSRWSAAELTGIQHAVYEISRCASVLYDRQPGSAADAVPETAEFAAVLDHHLAELAAVVAAKGRPAPGELRAAFDTTATRSGLADLVDPAAPDGVAHARGRALTLCLRTVTAVEELVSRLATGPQDQASSSSTGPAARRAATTLAGS